MAKPVIGFAGMTHLGLNSSVAGSERGFSMVCFDRNPDLVRDLAAGNPPINEPSLTELMAKNRDRLKFTSNPADLAACDVIYVAPDVATDDQGQSDLTVLRDLIALVDAAVPTSIVLVVLSQIPPGFSRALTLTPGRPYYYQVETLIFGRAIERALYPERYIVGCANPEEPLAAPYAAYLAAHECPVLPMRYESAELAKISINCCLVASVSVANTLAEICEGIGADWSEIVPALKLDRRIGPYSYLTPGLGIAGGNLERDLTTVCGFADRLGTDAGVVKAWIANSRYRKDWVLRTLHKEVFAANPDPAIAVLGLAYKEDTHSTKNSPSLALLAHLGKFRVTVYDPVVPASAVPGFAPKQAADALSCCDGADVLAIMTPWKTFKELDAAAVVARLKTKLVVDPYKVLDGKACKAAGARYVTLGVSDL